MTKGRTIKKKEYLELSLHLEKVRKLDVDLEKVEDIKKISTR